MYTARLSFEAIRENYGAEASERVSDLLHALRMNGQVCGRELPDADLANEICAYVMLPEATSFEERHHNKWVRRSLENLASLGVRGPRIEVIGQALVSAGHCACAQPSSYVLYTTYASLESPLWCGDCFLPVALYNVPATYDDEYYDIICWQSDYQACGTLYMNSMSLIRSSLFQLENVRSSLSQQGLEACRKLQFVTAKPVYYFLFRAYARSRRQELARTCPSCNGAWLLEHPWHDLFDFRCDVCLLVSRLAWNARRT